MEKLCRMCCGRHKLVFIAFDEQDGEMERRLNDASAKAAVAQTYSMVISVDMDRSEYNLIHYSGDLLRLSEQGSYTAFYQQIMQRMPSEDRKEMDVIFDRATYTGQNYRDGILRLYDNERKLHYFSYYSTQIRRGIAECILMTVRNVDDKHEAQLRDNALSNLCQCYYSIYLFTRWSKTHRARALECPFLRGLLQLCRGTFR